MKLNLTNIKPYARLGIVLAILVIIVLVVLISVSLSRKREVLQPSHIPSPTPIVWKGAKLPQPAGFEDELAKIKSILPYSGPNYTIKYRQTLNIVAVEIPDAKNRDEYIKIRQNVETFIKSKGVTDLCTLHIFWRTPNDPKVRESLDAQDIITTDCPPGVKPQ